VEVRIEQADGEELRRRAEEVAALIRDAVDDGASIGFVRPLTDEVLLDYVGHVTREVDEGSRIVLLASEDGDLVGMVHLALVRFPNGRHRADVQKLIVRTSARGRGIGRKLMAAIEHTARANGRVLLVLDTAGGPAETLYRSTGWTEIGAIPRYAGLPSGELVATTIFAKELG
jgi:GNAT superfamily N-acetyltransferase